MSQAKFARGAWVRALQRTASIERDTTLTLPLLIERLAQQFDASPALESPEASLSYRALSARCNQIARWGIARGLVPGDAVSLVLPNCAEYLAIWLGLTRIGVTVALGNTHLAGDGLVHSIAIVAPKVLIIGADLAVHLEAMRARLPAGLTCFVAGAAADAADTPLRSPSTPRLDAALGQFSPDPLTPAERRPPSIDATALYIYTSGTTGLPKAAKVSHYRLMQWSHWFAGLLDTGPNDRMYNCLPLYHSVGGIVATGATLVGGGTVVIRRRFSASDFWRDVRAERCTLFQYIGELCRYLVGAPPQPGEAEHALRIACGNGLRPEVWEAFQTRFRIPRILEYYASTEGNFSLYNCEGQPGSIGRIPSFLAQRLPVALLKFDVDAAAPWRNGAGFCEPCATDEVGEAVGLIPAGDAARVGRFEGYADAEASERKILRDVFKRGDAWYRTGDLMRRDAQGFYYFVDRVGDTFRWKGENVSTAEVLAAAAGARGVLEGVVYGVAVPGADGRAGMAALVVNAEFEPAAFREHVARELPAYARPVFLRLLTTLESTGTFKPKKQELVLAGFDPALIQDPLFVDDPRAAAYVALDHDRHAAIVAGRLRI